MDLSQKGIIFNIQRYCVNDGPGIRTTVFMKGCPLNCAWCHNPESKKIKPQGMFRASLCTACGKCAAVCEENCHKIINGKHLFNPLKCKSCKRCTEVCLNGAMEFMGEEKTVEEVLCEVEKDKIFYDTSNGGLTVSGGEPFYQFNFLLNLLKASGEKGISTAVETCGFVKRELLELAAPYIDLFLYDYKLTDGNEHKKYTGADNTLILENLQLLNKLGKKVILRCPIIKGVNDNANHFEGIAALTKKYANIEQVDVEPYHRLGESKAQGMGVEPVCFEVADDKTVEEWVNKLSVLCNCKVMKN